MKTLQEIYDRAIAHKHWVFFEWYPNYKNWVPKFIEEAKSKEKVEDWDKNILEQFIYQRDNHCVSSLRQKNFSYQEIDRIKKIWPSLSPLLRKLATDQIFDKKSYLDIKALIRTQTNQNMKAATHRLIAGLQPGILTTVVDERRFYNLLGNLKKYSVKDLNITWDYYKDNDTFITICKDNVRFIDPWHISLFAWLLYEYYEEKNKEEIIKKKNMEKFIDLLKRNKNIVLTGAPGTGKTYLAKEIAKGLTEEANIELVQFHPSYDYTDFVEGLRAVNKGEDLGFELRDGIFKDICKNAVNSDKDFVIIIDEINRAEISKVFGELFFSIDPSYRGEIGRVKTQYCNLINDEDDPFVEGFYVPNNVYIIGTMNDIDRSVESFDFAIRRRFAWIEIKAEDRCDMMWEGKSWKEIAKKRMISLNKAIEETDGLTSAFHIGPAYFLKLDLYKGDFDKLWTNHLEVLIKEYLRGMSDAKNKFSLIENAYNNTVDATVSLN